MPTTGHRLPISFDRTRVASYDRPLIHTDYVVIIRGPHKGSIGAVVRTIDAERILVRLDTYGPVTAFNEIVIERRFVQDKLSSSNLREHLEERERMAESTALRSRISLPSPPRTLPDEDADPVWNPSAPTLDLPTPPQTSNGLAFDHPNLWMFDTRLDGLLLRAQQRTKTVCIRQVVDSGNIAFIRRIYNKEVTVDPNDIVFEHPDRRHFCRFLVIRGDYFGRHVRGIGYESCRGGGGKAQLKWRVRVVKEVVPGREDDMLDDVLDIYDKDLVLGWEPKEDAAANWTLSRRLRQ